MFSYKNNNLQPFLLKGRRNDNHSCILFTNAKDEPNIAEWAAHHILLGFDKVIIFDHLSLIPISNLIKTTFNGKINILRVNGSGAIKLGLMERALEIALSGNYSWMLYLDADEFLNLNKHKNVKDFLEVFKEADAVGVNWLMFGTSGHINQPKGLITNNFIKSELRLNPHVKTFVRPTAAVRIENPHYYILIDKTRYFSGNGTRMKIGPFNNQPLPFMKAPAYIAHFYTQSEKEHLRRKTRMLDDGAINKSADHPQVHNIYNNVLNTQLKEKYSDKINKFLLENGIFL